MYTRKVVKESILDDLTSVDACVINFFFMEIAVDRTALVYLYFVMVDCVRWLFRANLMSERKRRSYRTRKRKA